MRDDLDTLIRECKAILDGLRFAYLEDSFMEARAEMEKCLDEFTEKADQIKHSTLLEMEGME